MTIFDQLITFLLDLPIYTVNGVLWLFYSLDAAAPALLSLGSAALMAFVIDVAAQRLAAQRPLRAGRGFVQVVPRTAQVMTGLLAILWTGAQWGMAAPVPWIGAVMWLVGVTAILAVPAQRFNILHLVKTGIAMYAVAVIASRIYLAYTTQVSPGQWATLIGSAQDATSVVANTQGNVTTIVVWALWLILPLGYFSMLLQQIFMNPMSLVNPFSSYEQMLIQLRDRGGK